MATPVLSRVGVELDGVSVAETRVGAAGDVMAAGETRVAAATDGLTGSLSGLRDVLDSIPELGVIAAGLAAAFSVVGATKTADTFVTIANNMALTNSQLRQMETDTVSLAEKGPAKLADISTAFEHIGNVLHLVGNEAMPVVTAAWKAAIETGAQVGDVANALATAMGNFHEPTSAATKDMGYLIAAAAAGNIRLQDLVTSFSRVGVVASSIHMPFADALAAFSTLTKATGNAAQAQTYLVGILTHMLNPTKTAQTEMANLAATTGIDLTGAFQKFSAGQMSFESVMNLARQATHGNAQEIMTLFGGIRGGVGALALLDSHWKDYVATQDRVRSASDLLAQMWGRTMNTIGAQAGTLWNTLQALTLGLVEQVTPSILTVLKALNQFGAWVIAHKAEISEFFNNLGRAARNLQPAFNDVRTAVHDLGDSLYAFGPAVRGLIGPAVYVAVETLAGSIEVLSNAITLIDWALEGLGFLVWQTGNTFAGLGGIVETVTVNIVRALANFFTMLSQIPLIGSQFGGIATALNAAKVAADQWGQSTTAAVNSVHQTVTGNLLDIANVNKVLGFTDTSHAASIMHTSGTLAGTSLGKGIADGITASTPAVTAAALSLYDQLSKTLNANVLTAEQKFAVDVFHHATAGLIAADREAIKDAAAPANRLAADFARAQQIAAGPGARTAAQAAQTPQVVLHAISSTVASAAGSGLGTATNTIDKLAVSVTGVIATFDALQKSVSGRLTKAEDAYALAIYNHTGNLAKLGHNIDVASMQSARFAAAMQLSQDRATAATDAMTGLSLLQQRNATSNMDTFMRNMDRRLGNIELHTKRTADDQAAALSARPHPNHTGTQAAYTGRS